MKNRGSFASCSAASWCICLRDGREWLHQVNLLLRVPDTSSPSYFLPEFCQQESRSSTCPHLRLLWSLLPCYSFQALALPAAQASVFHGSSLCVTTSFLLSAKGSPLSGTTAGLLPKWGKHQLSSPLALGARTTPPSLPFLPGAAFLRFRGWLPLSHRVRALALQHSGSGVSC